MSVAALQTRPTSLGCPGLRPAEQNLSLAPGCPARSCFGCDKLSVIESFGWSGEKTSFDFIFIIRFVISVIFRLEDGAHYALRHDEKCDGNVQQKPYGLLRTAGPKDGYFAIIRRPASDGREPPALQALAAGFTHRLVPTLPACLRRGPVWPCPRQFSGCGVGF